GYFPATHIAAVPRSPHSKSSSLSIRFAPPPARRSALLVPQNPRHVPAKVEVVAERHTRDERGHAETNFASPDLPGSGASQRQPAHSPSPVCRRQRAPLLLLPARATISPASPPAYRQSRPETACRLPLVRICQHGAQQHP